MAAAAVDGQFTVKDSAYEAANIITTARATSLDIPDASKTTTVPSPSNINISGISNIANWQAPAQPTAHPQAAQIIRQVEHYFKDQNLCRDAHLLGLIKEGNGSVSLNAIMGFKRMRQFKSKSTVREVLRQSSLIEITADGKRIKRRTPPAMALMATPKVDEARKKLIVPEDKPWLTKGMLKPTGFESYVADGPIKPEEYFQDREDYGTDISFIHRIETAVTRFTAKRKMHQQNNLIFGKFMIFGGMEGGQKIFTGGVISDEEMNDLTAQEIADRTSYYGVSERVVDAFDRDDQQEPTWVVDFEATAKAFLSSQLPNITNWYDPKQIMTATNVLRNFYNYLLRHDVCTEYRDQLMAARKICDLAEEELPRLAIVDKSLPGGFNKACSSLFGGNYNRMQAGLGDWAGDGEDLGWRMNDAKKVFCAGIAAYASDAQLAKVEGLLASGKSIKVVWEEEMGLEVVSIILLTEQAKEVYNNPKLIDTLVQPMGLLRCKRWEAPHAPRMDLPPSARGANKLQEMEFLVDEEILKFCYPGIKMEACVKELEVGIQWIDVVQTSYPSFFTWLMNENIREWKEPGPPREWMGNQHGAAVMQEQDGGD